MPHSVALPCEREDERLLDAAAAETTAEGGNRVDLLIDGQATYDAMFAAIAAAQHHVHLETYIIEADDTGNRVADALIGCRRRGVQVRLIYDGYGSTAERHFWDRFREAGIQLHRFNPPEPLRNFNFARYDLRDHRKILVVDGRLGFTGGINFYDAYAVPNRPRIRSRADQPFKLPWGQSLSGKVGWRDTHIRIEGPAVPQLQRLFVAHWEHLCRVSLPDQELFPSLPAAGTATVSFDVGIGGDDAASDIYFTYLERFRRARRKIWITQAYFVPDDALLEALAAAAGRGVDVRIIVPSLTDVVPILFASRHLYGRLLEAGVRIYEYQDAVLHAKTAVVDGRWSTVGSSNLDYLSFIRNHEVNAVVTGREFAEEMERRFLEDLARSREISLADWRARPVTHRVLGSVACRFREWF